VERDESGAGIQRRVPLSHVNQPPLPRLLSAAVHEIRYDTIEESSAK